MPRNIMFAAAQMDAAPAPAAHRLERASKLVAQAAAAGAQLIALPELFNTGYRYDDDNYNHAERIDGATVTWMKRLAAQHAIHIAGTLLVVDGDHVYNRAVLVAPDGCLWAYDKNYPWAFERAYYRDGRTITVAETSLGRIGMLICWDYAHPDLWERYAGKIDLMVMMSCPPNIAVHRTVKFPDKTEEYIDDSKLYFRGEPDPFGADLDAMARWMRIPVIHSSGAGELHTKLPRAKLAFIGMVPKPHMLQKIGQASEAIFSSGYYQQAKIIDAEGEVVSRVTVEGDAITVAAVEVPDYPPAPVSAPPRMNLKLMAYIRSDFIAPMMMNPLYRRGYRHRFGKAFAPLDAATKRWRWALVIAFLLGRMTAPKVHVKIEKKAD